MKVWLKYPALLGITGMLAVHLYPADLKGKLDNLIKNNPFSTGAITSGPQTQKSTQLELRGVMVERGVYWFNLYEAGTKRSAWVQRGEVSPFSILEYDIEREILTLEFRGNRVAVGLNQSKLQSFSNQHAVATMALLSSTLNSIASTYTPTLPANEKSRLGQVALEINKRREQRQKTTIEIDASKL